MSSRTTLALFTLLVVGCTPEAELEATSAGASSVAARWVDVRIPRDRSILEAPAVARASEDANGSVAALVPIRVEHVHVRAGTRVEAGDAMLDVRAPTVVQAAAEFVSARRRLGVHRARAEQLESLRAEGLVGRTEAFDQRATAAALRAELDRATATLRGAGFDTRHAAAITRRGLLTLVAPVSGVVATLDAEPGEIREPGGRPLATIVGDAPARIEVQTSDTWPDAASVSFRTVEGRSVELAPDAIASVIDPASGARLTWFAPLAPDSRFADGLRGTVTLTAAPGVVEVPVGAVQQETGASHVVRRRNGVIERTPVAVIATSGSNALVQGDLTDGDSVAADGASTALADAASEPETP